MVKIMIYELAKPEDLQAVYNVVQNTIKTIYPKYYPMEVVDFFCEHHSEDAIARDIKNGYVSVPTVLENGRIKLSEQWQWTSGDYSQGESVLVEV